MFPRVLLPRVRARTRLGDALGRGMRRSSFWMAFGAAFAVTEPLSSTGGGALGAVRAVVLGGLIAAPVAVAVAWLDAYAEDLASKQTQPRPRWEYLAFMLCYVAAADAGLRMAVHYGEGWPADAGAAMALGASVGAAAMFGRAASWGPVRPIFWWHHPQWLQEEPRVAERGGSPRVSAA